MNKEDDDEPILEVVFYKTEAGMNLYVSGLKACLAKTVRTSVKTSKPRNMAGYWEVRSNISTGIARVLFTVKGAVMILLHGFVKKSQKTPPNELDTARRRLNNKEKD